MICQRLGYSIYEDDGTYPDIANQLIEIKLQTSPTIDLGLHSPEDGASIVTIGDTTFTSEDVRYVIFDGAVEGHYVRLNRLYVVSGCEFTHYFPMFQGRGQNSKIQLPLPYDFLEIICENIVMLSAYLKKHLLKSADYIALILVLLSVIVVVLPLKMCNA